MCGFLLYPRETGSNRAQTWHLRRHENTKMFDEVVAFTGLRESRCL